MCSGGYHDLDGVVRSLFVDAVATACAQTLFTYNQAHFLHYYSQGPQLFHNNIERLLCRLIVYKRPWWSMSSTPPRDGSGISTYPVVVEPTILTPSDRYSMPPQTEPLVDNPCWIVYLSTPSLPPLDTGRGWSPSPPTEEQNTAINRRSPMPPHISTLSLPLSMSPDCITQEKSIDQHSNQTNLNPLSLLGKHYNPHTPYTRRCTNISLPPFHPTAEAAELSSLTTQEDLAAASILLRLHREDAVLASTTDEEAKTISSDTDSDATIEDETPYRYTMYGSVQHNQKQNPDENQNQQKQGRRQPRSFSSSSPTEGAAARQTKMDKKRKRTPDGSG